MEVAMRKVDHSDLLVLLVVKDPRMNGFDDRVNLKIWSCSTFKKDLQLSKTSILTFDYGTVILRPSCITILKLKSIFTRFYD